MYRFPNFPWEIQRLEIILPIINLQEKESFYPSEKQFIVIGIPSNCSFVGWKTDAASSSPIATEEDEAKEEKEEKEKEEKETKMTFQFEHVKCKKSEKRSFLCRIVEIDSFCDFLFTFWIREKTQRNERKLFVPLSIVSFIACMAWEGSMDSWKTLGVLGNKPLEWSFEVKDMTFSGIKPKWLKVNEPKLNYWTQKSIEFSTRFQWR